MYKAIYASAWDLADDGRDATLERIRTAGVNAITLAASEPLGGTPYQDAAGRRASSPAGGMVHFRDRPERYSHIKPQVHPMVRECDALAELQHAAPDLSRANWVAGCLDPPSDVRAGAAPIRAALEALESA
jgi:hypothetical protein